MRFALILVLVATGFSLAAERRLTSESVQVCYAPLANSGTWRGYVWSDSPWNQEFWLQGESYTQNVGTTQGCDNSLYAHPGARIEVNGIDGHGKYFVRGCDGSQYVAKSPDGRKCLYARISVNGRMLGERDFSSDSYDMAYRLPD